MQVTELLNLTQWIAAHVDETGIVGVYEQLQAILQQNAQGSQPQQPFEEQKENLISGLSSVPMQTLTNEQVRFLECIGIGEHIGSPAASAVEDILFRNPLDPATAASRLNESIGSIREGISRSQRLAEDLGECVTSDEALADDVLVRVKFAGDAAINNVVDLRAWANTWLGIVRGITMAHRQSPEDIRVIGAGRGSLLFDLATPYEFALSVTGIVYAALKVAEKVVRIRHEAAIVKGLKLSNKKIAQELEAEAKKAEEAGAEQVTAEFTDKLKIDARSQGDVVTALAKSVGDLVSFLRKGGEVDCVLPEEPEEGAEEDAQRTEIAENLKQIRKLEGELRQLEPGKTEESTGGEG